MRTLVVGDILVDTLATIDRTEADLTCRLDSRECEICFDYGSKIPITDQQVFPGGNAANVSVGLARLGVTADLISTVGDDDHGKQLINTLQKQGVITEHISVDQGVPTSSSFIVRYLTERTIFSYHAAHTITVPQSEADLVYLTSAVTDLTTLEGQLPDGAKRVFQPGTRQLKLGVMALAPILTKTDLLIMNEQEAAELLCQPARRLNPRQLLHALLDTKASEVVVTAGARGAYLSDGRQFWQIGVDPTIVCRDSTGVGDAFASAYVWARFEAGKSMAEAAQAGTINAGQVMQVVGAQGGLLTATEMNEHLINTTVKALAL